MMEYFTSPEQEKAFKARYQKRQEEEQDRVRNSRFRTAASNNRDNQGIQEEDRMFFVEPDGNIYLGEVSPHCLCPRVLTMGGKFYGVDPMFIREVQYFTQRHSHYMIVFQLRKGYSRHAGIYPARMMSETEELILEEQE